MANLGSIGQSLREYRRQIPPGAVVTTQEAVRALVKAGKISEDALVCRCSGVPIVFQGTIGSDAGDTGSDKLIAYEPPGAHHRKVKTYALFEDGRRASFSRDEMARIIATNRRWRED